MGSDSDIVIFADDVDVPVGRMRDDIDLRIANEKVREYVAYRELHRGHARRAAHRARRFSQPTPNGTFGESGITQHHYRVPIEFLTGIRHCEAPRGPVEQPHPELGLKALDAMAQGRFGNAQHPAGGGEATTIDHLHEMEEVVEVKHARPHRPSHWTLSLNIGSFSANSPAVTSQACCDRQSRLVETDLRLCGRETVMSDPIRRYQPLTAENAALVLVDHQVGLMTGVRDYSTGELKHNVVALAKAAKALQLPIIVTTTARDSMWGPTFPELVEALPGIPIIDRSSVNAFDDPKVAQAITATGRKKLIFAGISLEVCAAFPAITAVGKGLDAYVAVDASGTFSETKRQAGLLRMLQAGVVVSDYATLMVEILKDNARPEAAAVYGAMDMPWAKLVGQIAHAYGR